MLTWDPKWNTPEITFCFALKKNIFTLVFVADKKKLVLIFWSTIFFLLNIRMRRCFHDLRMISFRGSVYITFITRNEHFWLHWNNTRNAFRFGVLHVNSYRTLTRHWIENISFRRKFHVNTLLVTFLQSFKKYMRQTLVFMWNSALREKLNFCFLRVFG